MKRALCCLAIAALSLASAAQAQETGEVIAGTRPPNNMYAPPEAVDHMAIRVVTPSSGPPRQWQVTVLRSGQLQREEGRPPWGVNTEYSDFGRGVSVTWSVRNDGEEVLVASQNTHGSASPRIRERTGETQRWAGETCDVWAWRKDEPGSRRENVLTCVTRDGIELWQGYVSYDGEVREQFHTMIVQRRRVGAAEVRLPVSLLDWRRWRDGLAEGDVKSGYEVTLGGSGIEDTGGMEIVTRRRGDWTRSDQTRRDLSFLRSERTLGISHAYASLSFQDKGERRLVLERHLGSRDRVGGDPAPYAPAREDMILGRRCIWWDTMVGFADVGGGECRDVESGAALAIGQTGWGGNVTLSVRATRYSPSAAPEAVFTPPAEVFSWLTE